MPKDSRPNRAMLMAYGEGYRVSDDGVLIDPNGGSCAVRFSSTRYPIKSIKLKKGNPGVSMYLHKLMAYQKYGEAMFESGIEVRHLNGIKTDNSYNNIAIGTRSQNQMDIPKEQRSARAKAINTKKTTPDEMIARVGEDWSSGVRIPELCKKYRLKDYCVQKILKRYRVEMLGEKIKPFIPKLDDVDVRDIRIACGAGTRTQQQISVDFDVSQATISRVARMEMYAHVKD